MRKGVGVGVDMVSSERIANLEPIAEPLVIPSFIVVLGLSRFNSPSFLSLGDCMGPEGLQRVGIRSMWRLVDGVEDRCPLLWTIIPS
jgi:hypothetical protein